jgi:hypothetical protein
MLEAMPAPYGAVACPLSRFQMKSHSGFEILSHTFSDINWKSLDNSLTYHVSQGIG